VTPLVPPILWLDALSGVAEILKRRFPI